MNRYRILNQSFRQTGADQQTNTGRETNKVYETEKDRERERGTKTESENGWEHIETDKHKKMKIL